MLPVDTSSIWRKASHHAKNTLINLRASIRICAYQRRRAEGRIITDAITDSNEDSIPAVPVEESSDEVTTADLTNWFLNLFTFRLSSVIKRDGGTKWLGISRFHTLTDAEIVECLQTSSKLQRGFHLDVTTKFLVVQIPKGSRYFNADAVTELRSIFEELSIKPLHYQIDSNWYFYIFLRHAVETPLYAKNLQSWLESRGLEFGEEKLIVHSAENALPFPLQPGFGWLNERCQLLVRRDELSLDQALIFFLQEAGRNSVEPEVLEAVFKQLGLDDDVASTFALAKHLPRLQSIAAASVKDEASEFGAGNNTNNFRFDAELPVVSVDNVVTMHQRRLGDDLVSAFASTSLSPDNAFSGDDSRLVIFDEDVFTGTSESLTNNSVQLKAANEESHLLQFPGPKPSNQNDDGEPALSKRRKTERRSRPPAELTQQLKPTDTTTPTLVTPD